MSVAKPPENAPVTGIDRPDRVPRTPWQPVGVFIVIAFGLAWLICLPLWLADQSSAHYTILASAVQIAMMSTPLAATLVVVLVLKVPVRERLRFLGIWPLRPAKRSLWFIVASALAPLVLVLAVVAVSAVFGWLQLDLARFSGLRSSIDAPIDDSLLRMVMVGQLAVIPLAAFVNAIPAFGEEIGWRGWLLPALRPLGLWPALLLSGAIWGLWHAPLTLLGHNFEQPNGWGVLVMTIGGMAWGVLFGWLRLRSGSLWPAVIGHGALNAAGGIVLLVGTAGVPIDLVLVNPLGVAGWIVIAVVVLVLWLTGQFRCEPQLAPAH